MVQRLEGHAGGQGAIADDGDRLAIFAFAFGGNGHAERGADGGAGVAHRQRIVFTLFPPGEGVQTILLADALHPFPAPGQDLVRVGLMADIPDQTIKRSLVDVVQCDRQLDDAEAGGQVAAAAAD